MIKFYDSLQAEVINFSPIKEGEVSVYVCGPTVYDLPHLGHGRSAVVFDLIRRCFLFKGMKVKFVSNYTDIDDKMIERAKEKNITVEELARMIIPEYELDYARLRIIPPDIQPKATDYVEAIVDLIKKLVNDGYAYSIPEDGVYFEVARFKNYGLLSKQNLENLKQGARIKTKDTKRDGRDFALWKFKKTDEPWWPSPWGEGRPGWHIECSAMSWRTLGEAFDIHGGGLDLKFPHHECEIAQSKAVYGDRSFAKHWIHNGFITVNKEKMSKSLGNFFTLREIFSRFDPLAVRFFFLQTHYRSPIEFSADLLEQSVAGLKRIQDFVHQLLHYQSPLNTKEKNFSLATYQDKFASALDDDFNVPKALAVLFELIKKINSLIGLEDLSEKERLAVITTLKKWDEILAVIFADSELHTDDGITEEQKKLITEREAARKAGDFKLADEIRKELEAAGISLEDSARGTTWKKTNSG